MRLGSWLEISEDDGYNLEMIKARLMVPNPEYLSRMQQGFSTAGLHRFDPLFETGYRDGKKVIRVPRGLVNKYGKGKDIIDEREEGKKVDFKFKLKLGPTEEREEDQVDFVDAVVKAAEERTGAIGQASPGYGKSLRMDATLWTEHGPIQMKDVVVGTRIYGKDGKLHNVVGVYPQGELDSYKVTFSDGSSIECCMEHLWTVQHTRDRRKGTGKWETMSLKEIVQKGLVEKDGHKRWYIPMTEAIEFPKKTLDVDPYVLGCLLADGCFVGTSVCFSNPEEDIQTKFLNKLPEGCSLSPSGDGKDWCVTGFMPYARKLGLDGKRSYEKSVPKDYKYTSKEDRLSLLQGLFDCDGSVTCNGKQLEYSTTSEQLAKDVQFLVESLGGSARLTSRTTTYTYKGEKHDGRISYRLFVKMPAGIMPFTSEKHVKRYKVTGKYPVCRSIVSVEYAGRHEMQCIAIDSEDSLYLTDHCIVTHNTACALACVARLGRTTAVLVHKSFLMNQWVERIQEAFDIDPKDIGIVQQDVCDYKGKKIVVIMVQSLLSSREYPEDMYSYFGTVVVDECYSEDTEILTEVGWVAFPELQKGTRVAQYHSDGKIDFVKPVRYIAREYEGDMIHVKARQVDLMLTPGHMQTYKKTNDAEVKKERIEDMKFYYGKQVPMAGFAESGRGLTAEERFLIALQADGYIVPETHSNGRYCGYREVQMSFKKQRKIDRIREILKDCGYAWSENKTSRGRLRFIVQVPVSVKLTKYFDEWVELSNVNSVWGDEFIQEVVNWDGYRQAEYPERLYYSSKDSRNVDVVQAVAALSGYTCTRMLQVDNRKPQYSDMHRLYLWKKAFKDTQSFKKSKVKYAGKVYCVEVPAGHVIVRRNGCVTVSGNCHRFGAVEFRKAITKFPAKYRIGVTATPKRKDGLEEVFFMHIGEIAFVGAKRSLTAKIQYVNANMVITDSMRRGMLNWKKQYDMNKVTQYIVDCETRNRQIVKLLIDALKAGRKVMVLSSRREHLNILHDMFKVETAKQHVRFTQGFYVGGMAERDLAISATRHLILATFQMAQEGLDIPDLDTLFLVTPKGDVVQAVGRILRKHDGKKAPMVVDILDNDIPLCANLAKKRAKQYREMGCTF